MITQENVLYELWERVAFTGSTVRGIAGERVTILSRGERNTSAGPDYLGAVLLIDGELRVGPVEMHLLESDWFQHGHDADRAYDGVILHLLADPNPQPRLALPTITADLLSVPAEAAGRVPSRGEGGAIGPDLIAELAWSRLLRRAVALLRSISDSMNNESLRRAFILSLFDALGYSSNRAPMEAVARGLLRRDAVLAEASFDQIAALVFALSGLPRRRVAAAGAPFMSESRLREICAAIEETAPKLTWDLSVRRTAAPERRLWGAVKLVIDLYRTRLLQRLLDRLAAGRGADELAGMFVVRMGEDSYVGLGRAREIVVNALLPLAVAAGAATGNTPLLEGACRAYRSAPSLASNRIVRMVERRWLPGSELVGAFWQQGAIELHQRYLSPDRSRNNFIAEPGPLRVGRAGGMAT